ncbi:hypothetical protein [Fibrobacter sp. UBA4309]|uniref:hypothetical protein n=1 Tax=Fibrobacter sp. UBA4309 TaxID=1946537 RepID=UPI0025BCD6C1|nr:hypothetical protein [Fibrobacter sp. UBA4309]
MAWVEITADEYARHFANPVASYLRTDFNLLNADKVDAVRFLTFDDDGYRMGIVFGERGDEWLSPFSAPFGGFAYKDDEIPVEQVDNAMAGLVAFARDNGKKLNIVLPPMLYAKSLLSKTVSSMFRSGFALSYTDLDYAFDLGKPYESLLTKRMARRNLKTALAAGFDFRREDSAEGRAVSYGVIRENRESKNYDLKMSLEALEKTAAVVDMDFFTLYQAGAPIAAAIVYRVSPRIAQVIYWGDVPNDGKAKPMNMVAYKTFEFYREAGFDFLDVGPASVNGVPNVGLCSFKETVGCFVDLKYVFEFDGTRVGAGECR